MSSPRHSTQSHHDRFLTAAIKALAAAELLEEAGRLLTEAAAHLNDGQRETPAAQALGSMALELGSGTGPIAQQWFVVRRGVAALATEADL